MSYREGVTIYLTEERVFGQMVKMGAYYSTVNFTKGGIEYEVMVENDEFVFLEDLTGYDNDDD